MATRSTRLSESRTPSSRPSPPIQEPVAGAVPRPPARSSPASPSCPVPHRQVPTVRTSSRASTTSPSAWSTPPTTSPSRSSKRSSPSPPRSPRPPPPAPPRSPPPRRLPDPRPPEPRRFPRRPWPRPPTSPPVAGPPRPFPRALSAFCSRVRREPVRLAEPARRLNLTFWVEHLREWT